MPDGTVNTGEARRRLRDLIDAAMRGEIVLITREDKKTVQLVPVEESQPRPKFGSAKGLITRADDFDAPLPDFEDYSSQCSDSSTTGTKWDRIDKYNC